MVKNIETMKNQNRNILDYSWILISVRNMVKNIETMKNHVRTTNL
jgi:hypothetical protein